MEYRYGGNRTNSGCTWTMWQYTCTNGQMRTTCATWNATRSVVIQHGIRNTIDRSIRGMPIAWTNAQKCSNAQLLKCSNATNAQHYKMHHAQKCSNATNATNTQNCTTNCSNAQMLKCSNAQMHKTAQPTAQMLKGTLHSITLHYIPSH